jgi:hypothetical protein
VSSDHGVSIRRHPRARRASLRVDPRTGAIRVTLPPRAALATADRLIADNRAWIEARRAAVAPAIVFAPGAAFAFRGHSRVIDWRADHPRRPRLDDDRLCVGGPEAMVPGRVRRWLAAEALALFDAAARALALAEGLELAEVGIGDPRSRWGSCSGRGRIRLSWRLVMAPDWVWRAVVAHEVAHLAHMNHGPAFHALTHRLADGRDREARAWLAAHGAALQRVGVS